MLITKLTIVFAVFLGLELAFAAHARTFDKAKPDPFFRWLAEKNQTVGSLTDGNDGKVLSSRAIGDSQINGTENRPLTAAAGPKKSSLLPDAAKSQMTLKRSGGERVFTKDK